VVGAALLSVVFTQAQEPKPASTGDGAGPRGEPERAAAETPKPANINSRPFTRLAEKGRMMAEAGRLGRDARLDFVATVELNEDGSFNPGTAKFEWREAGDEYLVELAQQFVTAIGQSKLLGVLHGRAKTARITGRLDPQNVALGLEADFTSERDAEQMAVGYGTLFSFGRRSKEGTPEGTLYGAVKFSSEGKVFKAAFGMPKEAAAKLVAELLDRQPRGAPPNQK
jgi:hypothetical protein